MTSARLTTGDLTFDVTLDGPEDGELIVLLHGYPETRASWDRIIPALTGAGYRVLAPDQRAYSPGARPRGRRAYTLDKLAGDVLGLADALGADRFHVVGHDWGGAVAWALAASHGERLLTVTSLATPHPAALARSMLSSKQALRSWYMAFYQLPVLPELTVSGPGAPLFRRALLRSGLDERAIDAYQEVLAAPGAATGALNWYRAAPLHRPPTSAVAVPTLYIYAGRDVALTRRAADLTRDYVLGPYRYEVFENASHWLPEEHPDEVSRLLLEHVRAHAHVGA